MAAISKTDYSVPDRQFPNFEKVSETEINKSFLLFKETTPNSKFNKNSKTLYRERTEIRKFVLTLPVWIDGSHASS